MTLSSQPVSPTRLKQISKDACDSALATATIYDHAQTAAWNNSIINSILKALISESSAPAATEDAQPQPQTPRYKFCVNSTIIQHLSDPRPAGLSVAHATQTGKEEAVTSSGAGAEEVGVSHSAHKVGRRGMHSASGAYWNNEKDGMWSYKYEGGEVKGMDIVISIMWIAV